MSTFNPSKRQVRLALATLIAGGLLHPAIASASGESGGRPRDRAPVEAIHALVLAYARSIGCSEYVNPKLVVRIPDSYSMEWRPEYLAAYSIDVGCSGGNMSPTTSFAVVRPSGFPGRFFVDPELSRPQATLGFPGVITRLSVTNGEIVFTAKEYDFTKDALCCPSATVSGKVHLIRKYRTDLPDLSPDGFWVREPATAK